MPALVDGGLVIADSEAIAEYLKKQSPNLPCSSGKRTGRLRPAMQRWRGPKLPDQPGVLPDISRGQRFVDTVPVQRSQIADMSTALSTRFHNGPE
jgi:glutathione S-transferase